MGEWSVEGRVGLGCGLFVACLLLIGLIPPARRYVSYEWETQPKRLFAGRGLAMLALAVQSGAIVNNMIEASDSDYNCQAGGCGSGWTDWDGSATESMSRHLMFKGALMAVGVQCILQLIVWVPAQLRGLTLLSWLVLLTLLEWAGWLVPWAVGAGPYQWQSELYRLGQLLPMLLAIGCVWPYYRYNDTVYTREEQPGEVPDAVKVNYNASGMGSPTEDFAVATDGQPASQPVSRTGTEELDGRTDSRDSEFIFRT